MINSVSSTFYLTLSLATFGCLMPLAAKAQVTADGTTSTIVNQTGTDFTIEQGSRVGDNLFHSFEEFSVPTMGSASFNNAADIANIFSRVTGSNISNIDGVLSAKGAANLFLINPNGIIFGQNASLKLGGSFFASTAESLLFEGNTEFSAINPQAPPLLEINIPIGLNFRDNPGDIVNQSAANGVGLSVNQRENIALIGGDVTFNSGIATASGGRVDLGGVSETGTVTINEDRSLSFPDGIERADISLANSYIFVSTKNSDGGGSININARNLDLTEGSLLAAGIDSSLGSPGGVAGDIIINATDTVSLDESGIENILKSSAKDQSGDINITANSISLSNNSELSSDTEGQGDAGNIIINAKDSIDGNGGGIFARAREGATGTGGNVNITTTNLSLADAAQIVTDTDSNGNAGNVTINATSIFFDGTESGIRSAVQSEGMGNAGNIKITTDSLSLSNDAVSSTNTFGQGNAGQIKIHANSVSLNNSSELSSDTEGQGNAGQIIIHAKDSIDGNSSGIFARAREGAIGTGGNVNITTPNLSLADAAQIVTNAQREGDAGNVTIKASNILLDGSESGIKSEANLGNAGNIRIITNSLSLTNDASLNTSIEPDGRGDAGTVEINAHSVAFKGGSEIRSETRGQGDAGQIIINTNESISFIGIGSDGNGSGIFARVRDEATGTGGNVNITTTNLSLAENNQIVTDTRGNGNAGNVTIKASNISLDGTASEIRSAVQSTGIGNAGNIKIITDSLSLNNGASLNTSTQEGRGDAGTVEINATSVAVDGGSEIRSETTGRGNGGNVIINASDSVSVDGVDSDGNGSAIFGRSFKDAKGDAGSVKINTNSLSVTNQALVNVTSSAEGNGGDVIIEADSIELNRGTIKAQTEVGEGGNITLQIKDDLIMRDNSLISAKAFEKANGGNLTIDTEFIIAFPNQNNDIIAKANQGKGGNIDINALSLFGIEERPLNPITNDIDASSDFGLQGTVAVNTPEIDPTSGLIELPGAVGDASDQVSQNPCEQGVGSEFIITGKGGIPPNPNETLNSNRVRVGLVEPLQSRQEDGEMGRLGDEETGSSETPTTEAVPVQGLIFNDKGEVMLTSYQTPDTDVKRSPQKISNSCNAF